MPGVKFKVREGMDFLSPLRDRVVQEKSKKNPTRYFNADSNDESDAFDLHLFCSDGVVSAHRLVICNVSKYLMSMLDDQPPWYPIFVHIPDLPKSIVQILVDLAYTGEMKFPSELQSDVIDAMQTLGWVHTDCLSADYCDAELPEQSVLNNYRAEDSESGNTPITSKDNESSKKDSDGREEDGLYAVLKMNFPVTTTRQDPVPVILPSKPSPEGRVERVSFNEDEDDQSMEISNLPEFESSDGEENPKVGLKRKARRSLAKSFESGRRLSVHNDLNPGSSKSLASPTANVSKTSAMTTEKTLDENIQPVFEEDEQPGKSPIRRSSRRSSRHASFSDANDDIDSEEQINPEVPTVLQNDGIEKNDEKNSRGRKSRKSSMAVESIDSEKTVTISASILEDDSCNYLSASEDSNHMNSPEKRQRRKPKRFEDSEEHTLKGSKSPTKKKDSPVKSRDNAVAESVVPTSSAMTGDVSSALVEEAGVSGFDKQAIPEIKKVKKPKKQIPATQTTESQGPETTVLTVFEIVNVDDIGKTNNVNKVTKTPAKSSVKKRISGEGPRSTLITSYFTKKSPRKSEDKVDSKKKKGELPSDPLRLSPTDIPSTIDLTDTQSIESESSQESKRTAGKGAAKPNEIKRATRGSKSIKVEDLLKKTDGSEKTAETAIVRRKRKRLDNSVQVEAVNEVKPKKAVKGKKNLPENAADVNGNSTDLLESTSNVEKKRERKKRSFDEVSNSVAAESTKNQTGKAKEVNDNANTRPGRKSLRVAKSSLSQAATATEVNEERKVEGQESPKRKRTRKDTTAEDSALQTQPGTPVRRRGKKQSSQ